MGKKKENWKIGKNSFEMKIRMKKINKNKGKCLKKMGKNGKKIGKKMKNKNEKQWKITMKNNKK